MPAAIPIRLGPRSLARLPRSFPALACLAYLLVGTAWIWLSDALGVTLFSSVEQLTTFQTYKGELFVAISAGFLYVALRLAYRLLERLPLVERLLRDSQRQYLTSVDLSPDGVVVHSGGRIIHANAGFRATLGISPDVGLDGVPLASLVRADEQELIESQLARLSALVGSSVPTELRIHGPNGQLIEVEHASRSVRVGQRIVVQTHFRDLRARNQARRELELANRHLEERIAERTREVEAANEALRSFTHSVAHDLRAPVSRVDGFARALEGAMAQGDCAKVAHYTSRIRANTALMDQMIDGLLRLSRAERAELDIKPVDTCALLQQVLHEMPAGAEQRVRFAGELPTVHAHQGTLRQVWTNLLSNALKYSADAADPTVQVSAEEHAGEVVFHVRDHGIGFAAQDRQHLFGLFQRLPGSESYPGTGIGLTLVRRVVERHGGRVWASGEPGRGATFSFSLPQRG